MALLMIQGYVLPHMGEKTRSSGFLADWIPWIVADIGMTSVGDVIVEGYDHWKGDGGSAPSATQFIEAPAPIPTHTTGVQLLTQSAITCHTYPDNFFQVVIDSCLPIPNWVKVKNKIMASLSMKVDYSLYNTEWGWRGASKC